MRASILLMLVFHAIPQFTSAWLTAAKTALLRYSPPAIPPTARFTCAPASPTDLTISDLSRELRTKFSQEGTDGVLAWATSADSEGLTPIILQWNESGEDLVRAASLGSPPKSVVSGIINALLGACCSLSLENPKGTAQHPVVENRIAELTCQILESCESVSKLKPNLVSLCLAYTTLVQVSHGDETLLDLAQCVLQRANELYTSAPVEEEVEACNQLLTVSQKYHLWTQYGVKVLEETDSYIVVSKPSGMVCYHGNQQTMETRKRRDEGLSLEMVLLQYCPLSTLNEKGRGFVHRIDKGTSGCLVLAKTNSLHAQLVSQFFLRRVKKTYNALVMVGKDSLVKNGDRGIAQLAIGGKPAVSSYIVEQIIGTSVASLRVNPLQGRKHQIRIHFSRVLKSPILLDPLYGGETIMFRVKNSLVLRQMRAQQRFCLHAKQISIPDHGIDVADAQPSWWRDVIDEIETEGRNES